MAKDIKAIQCPNCGSASKQESKPDIYRCHNCGTEYYIDSDDVHIYYHHQHRAPLHSSAPPVNTKLPALILIGAVAFVVVVYFVSMALLPKKTNSYNVVTSYKMPRMYFSAYVYTNTATGQPMYLRMGSETVGNGDNASKRELHAQFDNALTGKVVVDRIMPDEGQSNMCTMTYKTYAPDMIYAIDCKSRLWQLDAERNELVNVTQATFKDHPQLSAGVAKLEFDYYKPMLNVMSNDGNSYYYFPSTKRLFDDAQQAESYWKKEFSRHYFEFGSMGDPFDHNRFAQLIENRYDRASGELTQRDVTPGRKYFNPNILYQDEKNLLIVVNTTAASDSPLSIQRIDVGTGKILWALPPDKYYLYSAAKYKGGFAVEYRRGDEADYVHGVLVITDNGKLAHNYQLARTE